MFAVAAVLAFQSLLPLAPPQDKPVDPARVDAAVAALEAAFKDGDAAARKSAISSSVDAVDKRVIALVAKGLKDKVPSVVLASLDALGRMRHADSAAALNSYYKREKKELEKDENRLVALLKAVGRQGDPAGIEVLIDSPFSAKGYPVIQARFFGLASIRDARSVDAVFGLLDKVGPNDLDRYMADIRLALVQLTGEDRGDDSRQWQDWWSGKKKGYELPEMKPLPDDMRARWNEYWGIEEKKKE